MSEHQEINPEQLARAIKELLDSSEVKKPYIFSPDEVDILKKLIILFTFVNRLGKLGKILLWTFSALGGAYLTATKIFPGLFNVSH